MKDANQTTCGVCYCTVEKKHLEAHRAWHESEEKPAAIGRPVYRIRRGPSDA